MQLLSKELGRLVELHIATHSSSNELRVENATVHYVSQSLRGMRGEWERLIGELRPDVVHVNCCWLPLTALSLLWAKKAGQRVVLTPHGMLEPWIMRRHYLTRKLPALLLYQKRAVRAADRLHATAESERDNLVRLGYNDRITVVPNGVDIDGIAMKSTWKRRREILFLSRVHVKKGINFLIEAAGRLRERLDGYTIRIAGEGDAEYIASLRSLAERMGVGDRVVFEGGVYGERKWELFRQADVFVLPTYSENFGIVVAEALASGTPVITTKGTPWKDLEDERCGWWTDIGTDATANALSAFLDTPDTEIADMGERGRRLVEEKYSARAMAEAMTRMYASLVCAEPGKGH